MATTAIVTLKLFRFEVAAVAAAALAAAGVALLATFQLAGFGLPLECLRASEELPDICDPDALLGFAAVSGQFAGPLLVAIGFLPILAGTLMGAPLVSRELEMRTATFAWSLTRSRRDWLARRVIILAVVTALTMVVPAIATTALVAIREPGVDPLSSFRDYGFWGLLLPIRALAVLGVGVFIGAAVGRVLPAVLLTFAAGVLLFGLTLAAFPWWMPSQVLPVDATGASDPGAALTNGLYRRDDGAVFTWDQLRSQSPEVLDSPKFFEWYDAQFALISGGYPGYLLPQVTLRESFALLVFGGLAIVGAGAIVDRRRPY